MGSKKRGMRRVRVRPNRSLRGSATTRLPCAGDALAWQIFFLIIARHLRSLLEEHVSSIPLSRAPSLRTFTPFSAFDKWPGTT